MWSNKKDKIIGILTVFAIVFFITTLVRAVLYSPSDEIQLSEAIRNNLASEKTNGIDKTDVSLVPVRLIIPKIQIDAKVLEVGITKRGNMATPNNFTDVGWYKYGVLPGEQGSAILAGHVDNGLSLAGVFFNLNKLEIGDDIFITTEGGKKLHFIVRKTETFDFDARDTNVFTENSGKLLKLITCAGTWVSQNKTHNKRLVVTAVLSEK